MLGLHGTFYFSNNKNTFNGSKINYSSYYNKYQNKLQFLFNISE